MANAVLVNVVGTLDEETGKITYVLTYFMMDDPTVLLTWNTGLQEYDKAPLDAFNDTMPTSGDITFV